MRVHCPKCDSANVVYAKTTGIYSCVRCANSFNHAEAVAEKLNPAEPEKYHGQIALSREPVPFRELHRNPFALRDLAMVTRR